MGVLTATRGFGTTVAGRQSSTDTAPAGSGVPAGIGPGCPADWPWASWADLVAPAMLLADAGFDAERAGEAMRAAASTERQLLTVVVGQFETRIGPVWTPQAATGCPACAETFRLARRPVPTGDLAAIAPWQAGVVEAVLRAGLRPGELVTVTASGQVRRHQVGRDPECALCSTVVNADAPDTVAGGARPVALRPRPADPGDPTRQYRAPDALVASARQLTGGRRFGSLDRHVRLSRAPFPISEMAVAPGAPVGYGRGRTVGDADRMAFLEAYERLGGYPPEGRLVRGLSWRQLGPAAMPLGALGSYTQAQWDSPLCRVRPHDEDSQLDWAWATSLTGGRPRLVPAEIAFPWYRYSTLPDLATPGRPPRNRHFLESSSGTALGASAEEAVLHALFECVERDAFQLAWHRRRPLVGIAPASITDPQSRLLMHCVDRDGFDLHLLVATADVRLPVVWALAVNRDGVAPASFSTAGAHPDPVRAVRAALWELAQQTGCGLSWDPVEVQPLVADPDLVDLIDDHWRRYTDPALLDRVLCCVGPDTVPLAEAFGDALTEFRAAAQGDLLAGVRFVTELLADAGLPEVLVVDQTSPRHAAAGMAVFRALVPGLIPLTFGQANQRYAGLPRLLAGVDATSHSFDPHPFP